MHNEQYYREMFEGIQVLPEWMKRLKDAAELVEKNIDRYKAIETKMGIPWVFPAMVHLMEAGCDFSRQILNGQRWRYATTIHPRNLGPFQDWEDAAEFALVRMAKNVVEHWPIEAILYHLEAWNGWGYAKRGKPSPYLWNGSAHTVDVGKFVADGRYDPTAHSKQVGAALVLNKLIKWRMWIPTTSEHERQVAV